METSDQTIGSHLHEHFGDIGGVEKAEEYSHTHEAVATGGLILDAKARLIELSPLSSQLVEASAACGCASFCVKCTAPTVAGALASAIKNKLGGRSESDNDLEG
jgi:hypothetical protein